MKKNDDLSVMLTPEGETLWIRRPEILLLTDRAVIDLNDYNRIRDRSERSQFDSKLSALLEAYAHEGFVEIVDYQQKLSSTERKEVYRLSQIILDEMSVKEKKEAGIYAHKQFANYLGAKLEHLNADEPLFKSTANARRKIGKNIKMLGEIENNIESYPDSIGEVQRRSISKWLAAEILARKYDTNFIFDLDGYRPYAKRIRERLIINNKPVFTETIFPSDHEIPFKVMWEVINTNLPGISIDTTDDLLRFKPNRKEFEAFRGILRDLIKYHQEVNDEEILFKYANRRFKDAQDKVHDLLNKLPKKFMKCLPSCLAYLLNTVCIPASPSSIGKILEESQQKEMFNNVKDAYEKLCCFSMYASRSPLPEYELTKDDKIGGKHWVTGSPLSWYEQKGTDPN